MKTVGLDPKVPTQAVVTILAWLLAHFAGIELSLEVETALAVVLGLIAGYLAPAPKTVPKGTS